MKNKIIIMVIIFIISTVYGHNLKSIEDLNLPIGLGMDIDTESGIIPILKYYTVVYNYNTPGVTNFIYKGEGTNFNEIKTRWQAQMNKKFVIGSEKIYLISQAFASYGIKNFIDDFAKEPIAQDRGHVLICDGDPEAFLEYNIEGYPSSVDYIEEILNNIGDMDFFYYDNYKLIDVYVRYHAEGRSIVLPRIRIKDEFFELSGLAIFKEDKMIGKINMDEARWFNMLRDDSTKGIYIMDYDEGEGQSIDYQLSTIKKVDVNKNEEGEYSFIITLDISADVISNKTDRDIFGDLKEQDKAAKELEVDIRKRCTKSLYSTVYRYNVDCLSLGKYAAAYYGRKIVDDWDAMVSQSDIEVKVNVKMDRQGRSDY
ncbi:hypothetical protein HZI73_20015 [Vallitalea pronyensis]|uniref:Germination protein, Ger(X)C family n=1 Tax=Vallitalea pronyensis TaxID=1348613 RepID=A0A8J8MMW8_9FIRM|nr:Ger(x)C family spore germination C-terminal domain-containing protein [Vallitalea pronyensis]QUI24444.1 hypothetical protein HZI73_20015 [Vallitalea pronyensis]